MQAGFQFQVADAGAADIEGFPDVAVHLDLPPLDEVFDVVLMPGGFQAEGAVAVLQPELPAFGEFAFERRVAQGLRIALPVKVIGRGQGERGAQSAAQRAFHHSETLEVGLQPPGEAVFLSRVVVAQRGGLGQGEGSGIQIGARSQAEVGEAGAVLQILALEQQVEVLIAVASGFRGQRAGKPPEGFEFPFH